jgi:predicted DNA-binding transcriptional regulator AlpA
MPRRASQRLRGVSPSFPGIPSNLKRCFSSLKPSRWLRFRSSLSMVSHALPNPFQPSGTRSQLPVEGESWRLVVSLQTLTITRQRLTQVRQKSATASLWLEDFGNYEDLTVEHSGICLSGPSAIRPPPGISGSPPSAFDSKVCETPTTSTLHSQPITCFRRMCPVIDSLLVDIRQLAEMLNRSVGSLERDKAAGRLPQSIRIGGSRQWRRAEIIAWVEAGCPVQEAWQNMNTSA